MDPVWEAGFRLDAGDCRSAIRLLEALVQAQPRRDDARYLLGLAWLRSGDPAKAQAQFLTAVQLSPQNYRAAYELGCLLEAQCRTDEAIKAYRIARTARPGHQKTRDALSRLGLDVTPAAFEQPRPSPDILPSVTWSGHPKVEWYAITRWAVRHHTKNT